MFLLQLELSLMRQGSYPISDRILNTGLSKEKRTYQGTIPLSEWHALIDATKKQHWTVAVQNLNCPTIAKKRHWFTNKNRALFYRGIIVADKGVLLDIGAGSGIISAELAKTFKKGVAIDYAPEATRFMQTRFEQDHIDNISVLRADGLSLAFERHMFDLISLNGVLEWVAYFTCGGSCRKI